MIADLKPYADYKETGQDWLGSVLARWSVLRAKRVFREVDERSSTGKEEPLSVSHPTGVTPRRPPNDTQTPPRSTGKFPHPRAPVVTA